MATERNSTKKAKVFRSVEEIRATYLPHAAAAFTERTLDDPDRVASVLASHIMQDLAQEVSRARRRN